MGRNAGKITAMKTATRILAFGFGLGFALAASAAKSPVWIVLGR